MILELKNIDKSFGEKEVLKGVSFTAEGGKAFGLLGRNGAGKTTSIRILMNVFPANRVLRSLGARVRGSLPCLRRPPGLCLPQMLQDPHRRARLRQGVRLPAL